MKTRVRYLNLSCLVAALSAIGIVQTHAASGLDVFIRFGAPGPGIPDYLGESSDSQFAGKEGWSQVSEFDLGFLNSNLQSTSSVNSGMPAIKPFEISKVIDRGSPSLMEACSGGIIYSNVQFVLRKRNDGQTPQPFYRAQLRTTAILSIAWSSDTTTPDIRERLKLDFGAIQWSYVMVDPTGKPISTSTVNWDIVNNAAGMGPLPSKAIAKTILAPPSSDAFKEPVWEPKPVVVNSRDADQPELAIQRLNANWMQISFTSEVRGPVRLQAATALNPTEWRDLDLAPQHQSDGSNYRWVFSPDFENPGQVFFRVVSDSPENERLIAK